jgi:hypothetical protein
LDELILFSQPNLWTPGQTYGYGGLFGLRYSDYITLPGGSSATYKLARMGGPANIVEAGGWYFNGVCKTPLFSNNGNSASAILSSDGEITWFTREAADRVNAKFDIWIKYNFDD